jgi:hypothetical protein
LLGYVPSGYSLSGTGILHLVGCNSIACTRVMWGELPRGVKNTFIPTKMVLDMKTLIDIAKKQDIQIYYYM